jgi:hypothetical protein
VDTFAVSLSPSQAAGILNGQILGSAISATLVGTYTNHSPDGREVVVSVYEKYFMRNSSRASLCVICENVAGKTWVGFEGSGGGQGTLFKFDWGAAASFTGVVRDALAGYIIA